MKDEIENTLKTFYGVTECTVRELTRKSLKVECTGGNAEYIVIALREICKVPTESVFTNLADENQCVFTVKT